MVLLDWDKMTLTDRARQIVKDGVPRTAITIQDLGDTRLLVQISPVCASPGTAASRSSSAERGPRIHDGQMRRVRLTGRGNSEQEAEPEI
jgi:hypothetical protein